jgi:hypothetical protein
LSFRSVSRTQSETVVISGNEAAPHAQALSNEAAEPGIRTGGDRVRALPEALPKTVSAAEYVRRSAQLPEAARHHAIDLVQALAAVECLFTVGGRPAVPAGLLDDVILIAARLTGRGWLEANADLSPAADFAAISAAPRQPSLTELDGVLATLLWSRFAPGRLDHDVDAVRVGR